ncbi:MAG: undecaprenyl-diphosphate phosphatase [Myxococcota bacterium]
MDWLVAAFLGLVQGVTEFLPVSSSGHLVLAEELLGVREEGILFEVAVHVATLVAVVIFYRRRIGALVGGALRGRPEALVYGAKLALATLPAVVLVLGAGDFLTSLYQQPLAVGMALLATGLMLITTRRTLPEAHDPAPGYGAAVLIGCAQAIAIVPGISRSGATVCLALALGVAPAAAAEFSFLMSVIAILGALVLQLPDLQAVSPGAWFDLSVGGFTALVSGLASLWLFVRLLEARSFHRFAYYVWATGAAVIVWQLYQS